MTCDYYASFWVFPLMFPRSGNGKQWCFKYGALPLHCCHATACPTTYFKIDLTCTLIKQNIYAYLCHPLEDLSKISGIYFGPIAQWITIQFLEPEKQVSYSWLCILLMIMDFIKYNLVFYLASVYPLFFIFKNEKINMPSIQDYFKD